ncbi:MAG: radical SAM protein [Nanoarchaeota archaeon]
MDGRKKVALVSLLGNEALTNQRNGMTIFNDLENLGLHYIHAVCEREGHEVKLFHPYQSKNLDEELITGCIIDEKPDVVGFSALTNSFPRAVRMAEQIKSRKPDIKIVFGSDHIGAYPQDLVANRVIDIGVIGEGENAFLNILDDKPLSCINGIAFIEGDTLKINSNSSRIKDRSQLPFAFRDAEILAKSKVGAMMYPPLSEQRGTASFLSQFGCPLGCTYCTATTLYNSQITASPAEHVVAEMTETSKRFNVNTAMFVDLTFNLKTKNSEYLCRKIADANTGISWYAMIRPTSPNGQPMVKNSLLEAMVYAGCTKIGFGVETTEKNAMKDYHRTTSVVEDERILRAVDELGALTKVFLMIGHPEETNEYYESLITNLKKLTPDEVRISFLTPFPGTTFWKQLANRNYELATTDFNKYTTFNPVLRMKNMSNEEAITQRSRILREYYSSDEFRTHVANKTRRHPKFHKSYEEFAALLKSQRII